MLDNNSLLLHDDDCEAMVLGSLLSSTKSFPIFNDYLNEDSFYNLQHKEVYKAIKSIYERGEQVSIVSVMPELSKIGSKITPYELTKLSGNISVNDDVIFVKRLFDLAVRRKLWAIGTTLVNAGYNESKDITDITEDANNELSTIFSSSTNDIRTLNDSIDEIYNLINQNLSNEKHLSGIPTGFQQLDDKGGLQGSDLIIIGGDTSQGKTSLAISFTISCIKNNAGIAFYTMEMNRKQLTARIIAMESNVPSSHILYDKLSDNQISAIDKGVARLTNKNLYFDDRSNSNIDTIIASIRSLKIKYDIKGAVVDYLQILTVNIKSSNKEQQLGEASRRLKNLAKELDIFIIALSQINRDKADPRPNVNRLRDSGQIAEAADIVILVYRPEIYNKKYPEPFNDISTRGTALIEIAKGRNIGLQQFICGFNAICTKFYPYDPQSTLPFPHSINDEFKNI